MTKRKPISKRDIKRCSEIFNILQKWLLKSYVDMQYLLNHKASLFVKRRDDLQDCSSVCDCKGNVEGDQTRNPSKEICDC